MLEIDIRKNKKKKRACKKYRQKMYEEDKQKKTEYMKQYKKNYPNNVLKNKKENNELKTVEVDAGTSFIKDEVESFSDADV